MKYSPLSVMDYFGARFWTMNNSLYELDDSGILIRASRETDMLGSRVVMIAGLDEEGNYELQRRRRIIAQTRSASDQDLLKKKGIIDTMIMDIGLRPETGLMLIMSVSDEDALKRLSIGISTSPLHHIEPAPAERYKKKDS